MKTICISGSVATGKTTLAKKLAEKLNYTYVDVNKVIKENKLKEYYDKKRKCNIIDIKKLNKALIKIINDDTKSKKIKGLIIDSHLSHYLPRKYVALCIITKCSLKILKNRLKKRKYNENKIRENLDCEIFDICLNEAKELKHRIIVIPTTKPININPLTNKIKWIRRQKN